MNMPALSTVLFYHITRCARFEILLMLTSEYVKLTGSEISFRVLELGHVKNKDIVIKSRPSEWIFIVLT